MKPPDRCHHRQNKAGLCRQCSHNEYLTEQANRRAPGYRSPGSMWHYSVVPDVIIITVTLFSAAGRSPSKHNNRLQCTRLINNYTFPYYPSKTYAPACLRTRVSWALLRSQRYILEQIIDLNKPSHKPVTQNVLIANSKANGTEGQGIFYLPVVLVKK